MYKGMEVIIQVPHSLLNRQKLDIITDVGIFNSIECGINFR